MKKYKNDPKLKVYLDNSQLTNLNVTLTKLKQKWRPQELDCWSVVSGHQPTTQTNKNNLLLCSTEYLPPLTHNTKYRTRHSLVKNKLIIVFNKILPN